VDDVSNDRRLSRRETADVLRDAPQFGFREEFLIQEIANDGIGVPSSPVRKRW